MTYSTLPRTLVEYVDSVRSSDWGTCVNTIRHGATPPIAEFLVADEYFASYDEARSDNIPWGQKLCKSCLKWIIADGFEPNILARRPKVILSKWTECSNENCHRSGRHFIFFNGKRIWFCAVHIGLMVRAGFESFTITREGKVKCTTFTLTRIEW